MHRAQKFRYSLHQILQGDAEVPRFGQRDRQTAAESHIACGDPIYKRVFHARVWLGNVIVSVVVSKPEKQISCFMIQETWNFCYFGFFDLLVYMLLHLNYLYSVVFIQWLALSSSVLLGK